MAEPVDWLRGFARYEDGYISIDKPERFQPMAHRGMVFDLAHVTTPAEAVEFASRFGLLWHGPESEALKERFEDWESEATTLRVLLRLLVAIQDGIAGEPEALDELRTTWRDFMAKHFEAPAESDGELLTAASVLVSWIVNEKLAGMEHGMTAACQWEGQARGVRGEPGVWRLQPRPKNLLGFIYYELALSIVEGFHARICEGCRTAFRVVDQRQRFCSATCANRARYRRWSEKKKSHPASN